MPTEADERFIPTGWCWCGCGEQVKIGSFFASGHDRTALFRVIAEQYGSIVKFLSAHDALLPYPNGPR